MDKHKKGYFSLLLEEYRVTEGWVYWLMMELTNGFQERTRIPWWDNIAWLQCMLNGVHKKEQIYCKIVKRVILCSQQVIHTVIVLHCVEYILIHKPVYQWNDLLWRIILHNPGFKYAFIIFSLVSLIFATVICIYWRGRFYANKCISLFKKHLSFFYRFAQLKYITGWWISINLNLYIFTFPVGTSAQDNLHTYCLTPFVFLYLLYSRHFLQSFCSRDGYMTVSWNNFILESNRWSISSNRIASICVWCYWKTM